MGWGATSYGGQVSDELLEGSLERIENEECSISYTEDVEELPLGITSAQVCAFDKFRQKDTW